MPNTNETSKMCSFSFQWQLTSIKRFLCSPEAFKASHSSSFSSPPFFSQQFTMHSNRRRKLNPPFNYSHPLTSRLIKSQFNSVHVNSVIMRLRTFACLISCSTSNNFQIISSICLWCERRWGGRFHLKLLLCCVCWWVFQ